jgi:hypothetical protein
MSAASILAAWVATHFTGLGARLFRNNVGMAWVGNAVPLKNGNVLIEFPRHLPFGLLVPGADLSAKGKKKKTSGGSDHVGWTPVTVTPDMVGQRLAVFTAVEEKTLHDELTPDQRNFLDQVHRAGGLAYVARETTDGPLLNRWPEPPSVRKKKGVDKA